MRALLALALVLPALAAPRAAAQSCEQPDAFEPNDSCPVAIPLSSGVHAGLTVQGPSAPAGADEDHYRITVQPAEALLVDAHFSNASGDVDLELFSDTSCTTLVDASYSQSDDESITWSNGGGAPADLVLVVRGFGSGFTCNDYDLLVSIVPDPCAALPDDPEEEDDDCAAASQLFAGSLDDRSVTRTDPDWYRVDLQAGATMIVEVRFEHDDGDLDLHLWDVCPTSGSAPVTSSETESDLESVGFTNSGAGSIPLWLEVYLWSGSASDCNTYEIDLQLSGGTPGTPLCFGDGTTVACPCGNESSLGAGEGCENSTGVGARLVPTGSSAFVNDDLVLSVEDARPGQTAVVIQGGSLVAFPFRDGVLCMGMPTERIELVALDAAGAGATSVSITAEGGVAGPGATTWYQAWYRDPGGISPCGTGSNLTQGVQVDWS